MSYSRHFQAHEKNETQENVEQSFASVKTAAHKFDYVLRTGSFRVKLPPKSNILHPTLSDFDETWCTCSFGSHSTNSQMLGQSDMLFRNYFILVPPTI